MQEGRGEAFYEVGVHDDGDLIGISPEQIFETMMVLFHIASSISATLSIELVRLGYEGYNVRLRVTREQPTVIEPEISGWLQFSKLRFLQTNRIFDQVQSPPQSESAQSAQQPSSQEPEEERSDEPDSPQRNGVLDADREERRSESSKDEQDGVEESKPEGAASRKSSLEVRDGPSGALNPETTEENGSSCDVLKAQIESPREHLNSDDNGLDEDAEAGRQLDGEAS